MNDANGQEITLNKVMLHTQSGKFCNVAGFTENEGVTFAVVSLFGEGDAQAASKGEFLIEARPEHVASFRVGLLNQLAILEEVSIAAGFTPTNMTHVDFTQKKKI